MVRRPRLQSISNKLLAVLVTVAVLPTTTVAIYALRRGTEALLESELTLLMDATSNAARAMQSTIDADLDQLRALPEIAREPSRLDQIYDQWSAGTTVDPGWKEELRLSLSQFAEDHPAVDFVLAMAREQHVLRVERREDGVVSLELLPPSRSLRRSPLPSTAASERQEAARVAFGPEVLAHFGRHVHQTTLPYHETEAFEAFLVRLGPNFEPNWMLLSLSWQRLLDVAQHSSQETLGVDGGSVLATLYDHTLDVLASRGNAVPIPPELVEAARQGQTGGIVTQSGDMIALCPVPRRFRPTAEFQLLVFRVPANREAVAHFRLVFSSVLAGALLLALVLGTYLARRMTRPLRVLQEGARRVGAGELDAEIQVQTDDEVQEVADAFVGMTRQLRSLYQGMEETISDRTQQLRDALEDLRGAHDALKESQERYSDIVENASDLIQVTDALGRWVSVNRRQSELFGRPAEDLVGEDFFVRVAADVREATRRAFQQVLAGSTLTAHASALELDNGRRVPVEISATPVVRQGRVEGVRAFLRDVSERRAMEAQLIKAERLSSVGALAAGVAHEINNPLGIIHLFAQRALEKGRRGEIDLDKLEKIVVQVQRVAQITKGLLDFSRSGPTERRAFSLAKTAEETIALLVERAERSRIQIETNIPADLPPVFGNAQQISQVLLNLLLNALQAIGQDGTVWVIAERLKGPGPGGTPSVRLRVEDTGPGIAPDVLPQLFEPFFTTKEPGEGTGLGLSVSYGILKEHHGTLTASNLPAGGARFEFDLPVANP